MRKSKNIELPPCSKCHKILSLGERLTSSLNDNGYTRYKVYFCDSCRNGWYDYLLKQQTKLHGKELLDAYLKEKF